MAARLRPHVTGLAGFALSVAVFGAAANAQSLLFANTNAGAGYGIVSSAQSPVSIYDTRPSSSSTATALPNSSSSSTGSVSYTDTIFIPDGVLHPVWQGSASGTASATASYGTLHASAAAEYHQMPHTFSASGYHDDEPWGISKLSPLNLWASGNAYAAFEDMITISSPTLAHGTQVKVRARVSLDSSALNGDRASIALATGSSFDTFPWYMGPGVGTPGYGLYVSDAGGTSHTLDSYLYFYVGDSRPVWGMLIASARVPTGSCNGAPPNCGDQSAFVHAGNTAHFYLDPMTSDFTITAFSGTNYSIAAAVPEPGAYAMLLAGLGLLGFMARRRKDRRLAAVAVIRPRRSQPQGH